VEHDTAIGSHPVQQRGDLMKMQLRGPLTRDDIVGMREMVRKIRDERGHCFLIADATELDGIDADARRMMAEWGRQHPEDRASGVAVHGVDFVTRTLITLTVNAVRLMGYREVELEFTRDEPESLRWIDQQRSSLAGEARAAS
jgi:hypothetical protein